MANINNFIVDYNKTPQIECVEKSNLESVNAFVRKIEFYNPKINEPLHKFWYFIPNAKLTKKAKGSINIVLSSSETKLIESIKSLDTKVDNILKTINPRYSTEPSIKEQQDYPPSFELCIDNDCMCYDQDNNTINYMKIVNGAKVLLYIEFESVTIGSKCTRNWKVMQIKETKSIDLSTNLFTQPIMPVGYPSYQPPNMHQPVQLPVQMPMQMQMQMQNPMQNPMMQYNPYTPYPGYYPPLDYSMNMNMNIDVDRPMAKSQMPSPGRVPALAQGRRIPAPPKHNLHDVNNDTNDDQNQNKLEKKQTNTNTESMYQPPTEDQLRNMIGKLKKATKRNNPTKDDQSKPPLPPSMKTQISSLTNTDKNDNVETDTTHVDKDDDNESRSEEKIDYVKLIKDLLDEQTLRSKQWRKRFDRDIAKMNDLMTKIENIIDNDDEVESESEQISINDESFSTTGYLRSAESKTGSNVNESENKIKVKSNTNTKKPDIDQDDTEEEDPFIIVR